MTRQPPFELTDALLERMLVDQAGREAPADLLGGIVAVAETTPQRRGGVLPRVAWPASARGRSIWLIVGVALLVGLSVAVALIGSALLRRASPLASGPLIVYQVRGTFADIYLLDVASHQQTPLGSVQLSAELGGQRIRWAGDGRRAFVFLDADLVQAQVDLSTRAIIAVGLAQGGGHEEGSPSGDRVAQLLGDAATGMSLAIVDLGGKELAHIPLPGIEATNAIAWAPDGSSVLLSGCNPCDSKAIPSPTDHEHLFLVPLDGGPIRQLTHDTRPFSYARFSPDGSMIAYSTVFCPDKCTGAIATVRIADGRVTQLTISGLDVAPAWSPNGDRIAFERGGDDGGIYVIDRDGTNRRRLTNSPTSSGIDRDRSPIWSPDAAWVAFTRDVSDTSLGDLWVVPSGGGDASLLARNAVADWGPSATLTAVGPSATPAASVSAPASASASAPSSAAAASASASASESAAPTAPGMAGGGPLLVFKLDGASSSDASTESVFTLDVGTGKQTSLGTLRVNESTCCPGGVQWSADGRRVFLMSWHLQAIANLDTGTLDPAGPPPAGQFVDTISRRGDRIARVDQVNGKTETIVISDLDGHELSRISVPGVRHIDELAWSPDDSALALLVCGPCFGDAKPVEQLFVVGLDGSKAREVTSNAAEVAAALAPPDGVEQTLSLVGLAWAPDGATIAMADHACLMKMSYPHKETCTGRLISVDVASGKQTALTTGDGVPGAPSWSPDGLRLAFGQATSDGERLGLFVVDRSGEHLARLADGDGPADWSPDGTWLEFTRLNGVEDTDQWEVWVVPADGGDATRIAEHAVAGW
jgi:Tol biopolymer transport system component